MIARASSSTLSGSGYNYIDDNTSSYFVLVLTYHIGIITTMSTMSRLLTNILNRKSVAKCT